MKDNEIRIRGIVTKVSKGNKLSFVVKYTDAAWKDNEGNQQYSKKYVTCYASGKYADILEQNLYINRHVVVMGKLSTSAYIDKEGNAKGTLVMNDIEVIWVDQKLPRQAENIFSILADANLCKDGVYNFSEDEAYEAIVTYMDKNSIGGQDIDNNITDVPF